MAGLNHLKFLAWNRLGFTQRIHLITYTNCLHYTHFNSNLTSPKPHIATAIFIKLLSTTILFLFVSHWNGWLHLYFVTSLALIRWRCLYSQNYPLHFDWPLACPIASFQRHETFEDLAVYLGAVRNCCWNRLVANAHARLTTRSAIGRHI